jgi:hypothetical protein
MNHATFSIETIADDFEQDVVADAIESVDSKRNQISQLDEAGGAGIKKHWYLGKVIGSAPSVTLIFEFA